MAGAQRLDLLPWQASSSPAHARALCIAAARRDNFAEKAARLSRFDRQPCPRRNRATQPARFIKSAGFRPDPAVRGQAPGKRMAAACC